MTHLQELLSLEGDREGDGDGQVCLRHHQHPGYPYQLLAQPVPVRLEQLLSGQVSALLPFQQEQL
jgi:hypothetical protein